MNTLPAALFVVDIKKEFLALEEAKKIGNPCNRINRYKRRSWFSNLQNPSNDDAIRSVKLFAQVLQMQQSKETVGLKNVVEGAEVEVPANEEIVEEVVEEVVEETTEA